MINLFILNHMIYLYYLDLIPLNFIIIFIYFTNLLFHIAQNFRHYNYIHYYKN